MHHHQQRQYALVPRAEASIWHDWVAARTALEMFLRSHGESVRPEGRFEPAENGRGYVVRIYARHGRPVADRIGWLRERRITSRRRKPEGAGDE